MTNNRPLDQMLITDPKLIIAASSWMASSLSSPPGPSRGVYMSTSYHKAVNPKSLMEVVDGSSAVIKRWIEEHPETKISHLVCTGSSGQSVAWPVSYKLGIPVCVVRKEGEKAHSGMLVGEGRLQNYILIDDFIASGDTIRRVFGTIAEEAASYGNTPPECRAIFLYGSDSGRKYFNPANAADLDHGVPLIHNNFVPGY